MKNEDGVDRITELPEEAKELILRRVPLQDAVRTSALSRQWRNKWRNTSEIVLDESFHNYLKNKYHWVDKNDFVRIVYDVLLNHEVPILSFQLYISDEGCPSEEAAGSWIHSLSKNGVRALVLFNDSEQGLYKLPNRFYSCVELVTLNLFRFHFIPPSTFRGFPNLKVLHFEGNIFQEEPFQRFITSCPLLQIITLVCYESPQVIFINCSESLKYLHLRGELKSVFINAHGLETLGIFPDSPMILNSRQVNITIVNALGNLQRVKTLCFGGYALKFLADVGLPHKYPMDSLTYIEFDLLDFEDHDQISAAVCIIRNALYLRHLEIKAYWRANYDEEGIPEFSFGDDITLGCLKIVEFNDLRGLDPELDLVMSLLACSPSLEKMIIKAKPVDGTSGVDLIPVELMRFSRASPKAEIHYSVST